MRKIVLALVTTASAVAMLFSYRTSTAGVGVAGSSGASSARPSTASGALGATAAPRQGHEQGQGHGVAGGATPHARPTAASRNRGAHQSATPKPVLVTGPIVHTRYGPVQVQLRVRGGRITSASALQAPSGTAHSQSITAYAVPRLSREVLAAQSAKIDAVSGATYTSQGYLSSLQAAVDKAHLG